MGLIILLRWKPANGCEKIERKKGDLRVLGLWYLLMLGIFGWLVYPR